MYSRQALDRHCGDDLVNYNEVFSSKICIHKMYNCTGSVGCVGSKLNLDVS